MVPGMRSSGGSRPTLRRVTEVGVFWFLGKTDSSQRADEMLSQTRGSRAALWLMIVVLVTVVCWSRWAEIDQLTRAPATVIASSKTKVVQSVGSGVVRSIYVSEGDRVGEGDTVLVLERSQSESAVEEIEAELAGLLATGARLEAEITGVATIRFPAMVDKYPTFKTNQRDLLAQRQATYAGEVESLSSSIASVAEELALLRPLVDTGDVSQTEVIRLERQLSELEGRLTVTQNTFRRDAAAARDRVDSQVASLSQRLRQRQDQLARTELVAPVNGIIKSITVNTEGAVVAPGQVLMEILPVEDSLVVEAKISPAEIAFVDRGMEAIVKIDAYDYTIYGELRGVLTYVSADTLVERVQGTELPFYRAQVTIDGPRFSKHRGRGLAILPGMTALVEIKTGTSTVFDYLAKPVVKTVSESFSDR